MSAFGTALSHWWFSRFHRTVRFGWIATNQAVRNYDMPRLGMGLVLLAYGLGKGRGKGRRLIYKTSIDVDQGTTIRVMRGRRPIAEIPPTP